MKTHSEQITLSRRAMLGTFMALFTVPASAAVNNLVLPTLAVPVKDTVNGATENIAFSGTVTISAKQVDDPDFKAPRVLELVIDFSGLKGVGQASGKTYLCLAQAVLHRPLLELDQIRTSFPYYPDNNVLAARTAVATFTVTFPSSRLNVVCKLSTP